MELAMNHGVSLRQIQQALEHSAQLELPLDVVLMEMKAVGKTAIAAAATAANYVLTAEQPAEIESPLHTSAKDGARAFVRHATKLAVKFHEWDDLQIAYTNNISRGGLGVILPASTEAPSTDSVLSLALTLPDGSSIEVKAQVVYSRLSDAHRHLGFQLHPSDMKTLLQIDGLLRKQ
tara:strand:+ start:72184 stop:72714 length:531 start_codon:yes stop_codon:yes gene_type:complete